MRGNQDQKAGVETFSWLQKHLEISQFLKKNLLRYAPATTVMKIGQYGCFHNALAYISSHSEGKINLVKRGSFYANLWENEV